jgi:hypothetical protein
LWLAEMILYSAVWSVDRDHHRYTDRDQTTREAYRVRNR